MSQEDKAQPLPVDGARARPEGRDAPAVRNLALAPPLGFTGRKDELDRIRQLIASGIVAVHGLGGVGKTQLALAYAAGFMASYDVIWWLRAEQPATLAADVADLAVALRLPGRGEPDQRAAIEAAKAWLSRNQRWLLVFDSVRDPKDLAPYLVPGALGHVLVTSRHASWRGVAQPLHLRGLRRREAVELLLARSGARERSSTDQARAADALAEALGDLPLALAQAAAFMEEHAVTVPAYLDLFRERQEELLRRGAASDAAPTVATTWDIAFRELSARAPAAAELLALASYLAPDDIPRDALRDGAGACPPALAAALRDPIALGEQVAALRRYSLIEAQDDALGVHRLVQAVVRERLDDAERRTWAERAVKLVDQIFPSETEDPAGWPECRRMLPHVRVVCERAGAAGVAQATSEPLYHRAARYCRHSGAFPEAQELYRRALALATPLFGPRSQEVAALFRGLALTILHGGLDDPREAQRLAEWALEIDLEVLGPDDAVVARDHLRLVQISRVLKDRPAMTAHLERVIAIYEKLYGPEDPNLIALLNDRGFLLREEGDLEGARKLLERALHIGERRLGPEDPDVATFHSNLAAVLEQQGRFAEAKSHALRAVEIGEKCYGPDHYAVAIRRNNLGVLLWSMGDLEGAQAELSRAADVARKVFPPGHRRLKQLDNNLEKVTRELAVRSSRRP